MYFDDKDYKADAFYQKLDARHIFSTYVFPDPYFLECLSAAYPCAEVTNYEYEGFISIKGADRESMHQKITEAILKCINHNDKLNKIKSKFVISSCAYTACMINDNTIIIET